MAERKKSDTSRSVKNSLLTAADFGFPYESFPTAAVLVPAAQNNSSALLEDVGEVDSFVGQNPPLSSSVLPPFSAALTQNKPGVSSVPVSTQGLQRSYSPGHSALSSSDINPINFFSSQPDISADPFSLPPSTLSQIYQPLLPQTAPVSESVPRSFSGRSTPTSYDSRPPSSVPLLSTTKIGQPYTAATVVNTSLVYSRTPTEIPVSVSSNSYFKPLSPVPFTSSQGEFLPKPPPQITPPLSSVLPPVITPPPSSIPPAVITPPPSGVPPPGVTPPPSSVLQFSQQPSLLNSAPAVSPVSLTSVAPPGSGTNTYRLGNQRKLQYAQPPGLSVALSPSVYSPASISAPQSAPPPVFTNSSPIPEQSSQFTSPSFTTSPFVASPLEDLQSLPSVSTISSPSSTSSFLFPTQNSYVSPLAEGNLTAFSSPAVSVSSQHSSPSVASYFPSPIVAAANAMAATVAAANGAPQFQAPTQTPTDASVIPASFNNLSIGQPTYRPVYHHWFLKKEIESKVLWHPFSMADSLALEAAFTSTDISPDTVVATDGGRYDVNILRRQRTAVYWEENPSEVRRCSWFYKGAIDSRYVPYEESVATKLEEEFKIAMTTNEWHRRVELAHGETVVFHGPNVMVHFPQATSPDAWGNTPQVPTRPRVVKRGVDEFDIEEGEPPVVDHLLFLVHGVGSACDLKFRTVEEVVDDFRSLSLQLVQSHFRTSVEQGKVNRIEVLPVSWHSTLHGEDTGIDQKLKCITLPSIPKLRHFTNDTLLDILFYTSPVFCETIIHTVGKEINRLYELFRSRHPNFHGGISVGGHSLGSLILFDLLCHQKDPQTPTTEKESKLQSIPSEDSTDPVSSDEVAMKDPSSLSTQKVPPHLRRLSHRVSYVMGNAGTGQPFITYPQLNFHPKAFFAMGSPIAMFVTVRGIDALGEDFKLPTCPGFFNIFHPFDPVAYRIETLINPDLCNLKPVMIPHHKGRKRMHLELKETMARVGADLKQKFLDSVRSTWNTVYHLAMFHRSDTNALEQEVDKVIEEQLQHQETESSHSEEPDPDVTIGKLNSGRRVDYVLQEAPLESFNEYLFALGSHVCYWESEDTMLMILKEVYTAMGISADSNVHPLNVTYERRHSGSAPTPDLPSYQDSLFATPSSSLSQFIGENTDSGLDHQIALPGSESSGKGSPSTPQTLNESFVAASSSQPTAVGMDPTAPPSENKNLGPPPISGFVRK